MKNLLLIPAMVFALATATATDLPTLSIVKDKTLVLNINDWNTSELLISFSTPEGLEIYSEKIQPSGIQKKEYTLQILRKGSYQVVVSNGKQNMTYNIVMGNESIAKVSRVLDTYPAPVMNKDIISKIKFITHN